MRVSKRMSAAACTRCAAVQYIAAAIAELSGVELPFQTERFGGDGRL